MSIESTLDLRLDFGEDGKRMIPVATQDWKTKEVLILAFANKEAYEETLKTGYATYWSRSKNKLWTKGLTSGDMLAIREIRINCEQNSLLYLVDMVGDGACHFIGEDGKAMKTCYYRRINGKKLEFI